MKNAIKYWSRMNELTCFNWKLESCQKIDKFVTSKTKILLVLSFFETNTKLSVDSFYFSSYPFRKSAE